jgi:DNA-binding CsgD family transcriptional regulator
MIQTLIRPLYDKEHHTIYTKCIRIDEEMSFLTNKEKHIVKKIISGLSYEEIATLSHISINTLKSHIKNIFSKYGVNSKIELFQKLHVYN